jgi:hypothetical protein
VHHEDGDDIFLRNIGSYKGPHSIVTPQNTAFFIVTAVKILNPKRAKIWNHWFLIIIRHHKMFFVCFISNHN